MYIGGVRIASKIYRNDKMISSQWLFFICMILDHNCSLEKYKDVLDVFYMENLLVSVEA